MELWQDDPMSRGPKQFIEAFRAFGQAVRQGMNLPPVSDYYEYHAQCYRDRLPCKSLAEWLDAEGSKPR
jgi:hypothetical protein